MKIFGYQIGPEFVMLISDDESTVLFSHFDPVPGCGEWFEKRMEFKDIVATIPYFERLSEETELTPQLVRAISNVITLAIQES